MSALVAAWGGAAHRFERFREIAAARGWQIVEHTPAGSSVRLGTVDRGGAILATASAAGSTAAALGSGLFQQPGTLPFRPGPVAGALLDDAPDDIVGILADPVRGTLTIGASPGNQRLFVATVDGGALVSSQLSLLAGACRDVLELDRSQEDFLLGFGFLPDGRTPYRGIRAHPAGQSRTWPAVPGTGAPARKPDPPAPPSTPAEARRVLERLFHEVLEEQTAGRRRHAVLLGGFDSALVVAGLRRLGHEVDAYTFHFGDPRYDQRNAELVARHLGARHHRVLIEPSVMEAGLQHFDDFMNQPAPQPHYQLHTAHACRQIAAAGYDHVFTGDGADAAFLGYPTVNRRGRLIGRLSVLPPLARRGLLALAGTRTAERHAGHVARMVRSVTRSLDLPWPARGHLPTQYLDETALARLRRGEAPRQDESIREIRIRLAAGLEHLDPVRLAFHGNALTGQSRAKVEAAASSSGVAQLSPYLHPRLRDWAGGLPVELLRPRGSAAGGPGKAILVDMVREHSLLPEPVIDMPKQSPADSPIDDWYAGPLRGLVTRMLEGLPFEYDRAYLDQLLAPKPIERIYRERVSLGHQAFQAVGLLTTYAAFTRRAR